MTDVKKLAEWFVAFKRGWSEKKDATVLADDEAKMFVAFLTSAGFEVEGVEVGVLNAHNYRLQSRMMPVNVSCPFRATSAEERVTSAATSWLDRLWEFVSSLVGEQVVEAVREEMLRSIPLAPIPIGPDGEELIEFEPSNYGTLQAKHTRDESALLYGGIGKHRYCGGGVSRIRVANTYDALVCGKCYVRAPFPRSIVEGNERRIVMTFGDLRIAMAMLKRNKWHWPKE